MKSIRILFPYLLVTVLCLGGVELFYDGLKKKMATYSRDTRQQVATSTGEGTKPTGREERYKYEVIAERNLFGSIVTDIPAPNEDDTSVEELETTTLDILLLGTISGESDEKRAFIVDKSTRIQEVYQEGDAVQGAIIKEILRGKVILNFRGTDEVLLMNSDDESERSAAAVNPSPRRRQAVAVPTRSSFKPPSSSSEVRTAPPKRRFSFKKPRDVDVDMEDEAPIETGLPEEDEGVEGNTNVEEAESTESSQ